jgi:hypothetical protein
MNPLNIEATRNSRKIARSESPRVLRMRRAMLERKGRKGMVLTKV